jgi:glycosyltransferase involved in cell wall biosynthesis
VVVYVPEVSEEMIALLGRRDEPTDAVEEYCRYLSGALEQYGRKLSVQRVGWAETGWNAALKELRARAEKWSGRWVILQYTALAWSARGFPSDFLRVLAVLRGANARLGVVFHDVEPYSGSHWVDRLRRMAQLRTMRRILDYADMAVFTVPISQVSWKPNPSPKLVFIPVGANLPARSGTDLGSAQIAERSAHSLQSAARPLTVAVFSITGGSAGDRETNEIVAASRHAAQHVGPFRLSVFGRHAGQRESALRDGLRGAPVKISVEDVLDGDEVIKRLYASDVLLFVRGGISSRRGSAIAGIACGLPIVGYRGTETAWPVTNAGVALVPLNETTALCAMLTQVLSDASLREELAGKARAAYSAHFCWPAIAKRFAEEIEKRSG